MTRAPNLLTRREGSCTEVHAAVTATGLPRGVHRSTASFPATQRITLVDSNQHVLAEVFVRDDGDDMTVAMHELLAIYLDHVDPIDPDRDGYPDATRREWRGFTSTAVQRASVPLVRPQYAHAK
jgi:hypothetical protein